MKSGANQVEMTLDKWSIIVVSDWFCFFPSPLPLHWVVTDLNEGCQLISATSSTFCLKETAGCSFSTWLSMELLKGNPALTLWHFLCTSSNHMSLYGHALLSWRIPQYSFKDIPKFLNYHNTRKKFIYNGLCKY